MSVHHNRFGTSNHLVLEDKSHLECIEKVPKTFLNKMTVLYGPSGTGKSTILNEIMWILKSSIPIAFVISPTNHANQAFTDVLPKSCIKSGHDPETTIKFLRSLLKRQSDMTNLFNMAHDKEILAGMFELIVDSRLRIMANKIIKQIGRAIMTINRMAGMHITEKQTKIAEYRIHRDELLVKLYRRFVKTHERELFGMKTLTKKQRLVVKFLEINPSCMLILDDCASNWRIWAKKAPDVFKAIFYQFRQLSGTSVICTQSDKDIDSSFRINVMVSIFTNDQTATNNFRRSANGFTATAKKKAEMCIKATFPTQGEDFRKTKNYKKLVYLNNDTNPYKYVQANVYPKFKMCTPHVWKLDANLRKQATSVEKNDIADRYS